MSNIETLVTDIEDILPQQSSINKTTSCSTGNCNIIPRINKKELIERKKVKGYDIPGTQIIYMKTFGCSHNNSDSEYMAGQLVNYGYGITEEFEKADAYLINSCTVKNPSQDVFENLVERARKSGKPVIVAGCVPQGEPNSKKWEGLSVIGVQQIHRVVEVVEQALKGNQVRFLERKKTEKPALSLPKIRRNPFIEIISINVGCLNQCTYCKTKHARGHLGSYPVEEIVDRVRTVIKEGVKEIWLTSEDTGAYGLDIGTNIVNLLKAIVPELPDGVMLRVGMTNPPYILKHLDGIAEILNHPNVYGFLHVPVQSGANKVLYDMKREYTVEEFSRVVDVLREKVPGVTIATDIICGFPTEEDDHFDKTMELVEKYKFPVLNISQFYPRPGTPAAQMKRVPTAKVKQRSRRITALFDSYKTYDHLVGTIQRVWITEVATDKHHLAGRTKNYVQVLIDPSEAKMGTNVYVKVTEASKFYVKGKVIKTPAKPKRSDHLLWIIYLLSGVFMILIALFFRSILKKWDSPIN